MADKDELTYKELARIMNDSNKASSALFFALAALAEEVIAENEQLKERLRQYQTEGDTNDQ